MPVIQRTTIVPANDVVENVLAGSAFEFARQNTFASMGVVQESAGVFVTIQSGGDVVAEEFQPEIELADFPARDSQFYYNDVAVNGDRLVIRARNSTGADIVLRTIVELTAV